MTELEKPATARILRNTPIASHKPNQPTQQPQAAAQTLFRSEGRRAPIGKAPVLAHRAQQYSFARANTPSMQSTSRVNPIFVLCPREFEMRVLDPF